MARHRADDVDASDIVITTPGLTDDEIAAVTAVLTAALREQAGADEPVTETVESGWMRARRPLRRLLDRGPGAWRGLR